jgi:acetyl-CoA carboxylase biotin carboxylase subunit
VFAKVLIANRGEIAVRIARACRELGVRSVAIFSDADRDAPHVRACDEAYHCGPAPAAKSYLDAARIVEIAVRAGAQAVHPGYGFLSENAAFAQACRDAKLVFIGPAPETIAAMGDKVDARKRMQAAGVPIVPGTTERLSDEQAIAFAKQIGFPVMLKAAAGGGGRGLRLVRDESQLAQSLARARSEAKSGFGDDSLYVEKCVEQPRHVEIQILGDSHGNVIHLFERECSIQRRHQKLIEEAPATRMTPKLREAMGRAAIAAAQAVGYEGAGTCEFLLDAKSNFYFLEMNTRIQVEHAVTELVTGIDLVQAGIRIAAGESLDFKQDDVGLNGWALECRIYAEDPDKSFLPSPGKITTWRVPEGPGVRVDSGVHAGSEVTVYYDPMLAKLCTWGRNRREAIARMRRALDEFVIKGVKTSLPFHRRVLENARFIAGDLDTGFIEAEGLHKKAEPRAEDGALSALALRVAAIAACGSAGGRAELALDGESHALDVRPSAPGFAVSLDGGPAVRIDLAGELGAGASLLADGAQYLAGVDARADGRLDVNLGARVFEIAPAKPKV